MLDFGIAKVMSDDRQVPALTAVGQTLGTLEFMSPEQLRGQKLDGRSDIYALGMMAYEMLTGKLPFQSAKTPIDIINFHMKTEPPLPSKLADHIAIPAAVDAIIVKMVAEGPREPLRRRDRAARGDRAGPAFDGPHARQVRGAIACSGSSGRRHRRSRTLIFFLRR